MRSLNVIRRYNQIRPFLNALASRRGDIALIGDSNIRNSGDGFGISLPYAWGKRFTQYATGVHGTNAVSNYQADYESSFGGAAVDAVPGGLGIYSFLPEPFYRAGAFGEPYGDVSVGINLTHPRIANEIKWRFRYHIDNATGGTVKPVARYQSSFTYLAKGSLDSSVGVNGMAEASLTIPAGVRSTDIWFAFQGFYHAEPAHNGAASGPFYSNHSRLDFSDVYAGVAVGTLLFQGAVGTRVHATNLLAMTPVQFNEWVKAVVIPQNDRPILMVMIRDGANDIADHVMSVGANPAFSDTVPGVVDNHDAIIQFLRARWIAAGYDADDLYFSIGNYHPQDLSRRQWSRDLDEAFFAYADANEKVSAFSRSRHSSSAFFDAALLYVAPGDDAHLNGVTGFRPASVMEVEEYAPLPTAIVPYMPLAASNYRAVFYDTSGQPIDAVNKSAGPFIDALVANYGVLGEAYGTSGGIKVTAPALPKAVRLRAVVYQVAGANLALGDFANSVWEIPAEDFDGVGVTSLATEAELLNENLDAAISSRFARDSEWADFLYSQVALLSASSANPPADGAATFGEALEAKTDNRYVKQISLPGYTLTGWETITFAIKQRYKEDDDNEALLIVRISNPADAGTDGIIYHSRNSIPSADPLRLRANITVAAEAPDALLVITLNAEALNLLPSPETDPYQYEINVWRNGDKEPAGQGDFKLVQSVLRETVAP